MRALIDPDQVRIVPANEASWDDVGAVFGERGDAPRCWCQRFKLAPKEAFKSYPPEVRAERMRVHAGDPEASTTSGLIAYLDGEPVGWAAVEPRPAYPGLLRVYKVPWEGRDEDKADTGVWAVTCILVRSGFRKRGLSVPLARAAVEFARSRGARALEGYPMIVPPGVDVTGRDPRRQARGLRGRRLPRGIASHPAAGRHVSTSKADTESKGGTTMAGAPIILVPGFWLGAWAWDEVADKLRAHGHDVTALTLPGMESADADRSAVSFDDHVDAIVDAVESQPEPPVLVLHSGGLHRVRAASDRIPDRIAAMVHVDTAPEAAAGRLVRGRREAARLGGHRGRGEPRRALRRAEGDVPSAGAPGAGRGRPWHVHVHE